jgi:phosphoribosylaminoimidazole-succinocarboxamide synthase
MRIGVPTNRFGKKELLYEGSVKRIFSSDGTAESGSGQLIFEFTDDYSVFDWGKMPDTIPEKGKALARLTAVLFEKLQDPKEWQKLAATKKVPAALTEKGLRTHYKGFDQSHSLLVEEIHIHRPQKMTEKGREYYIYPQKLTAPYLIPLEVVFRFEVGAGSSLTKRHPEFKSGHQFSIPYVEMFTKLEEKDRPLDEKEALIMSGLSAEKYQEVREKTALVAELLKFWFGQKGIRLIDGKLEWGVTAKGEIMLVDAIGPDEMRLEKNQVQLSKEVLRDFYRKTPWFHQLEHAKDHNITNWKSQILAPPPLPQELKSLVSEMYLALVGELVGQDVFVGRSLDVITEEMKCKSWS